jgi:sugar-specific transcriptional regulator TrmB
MLSDAIDEIHREFQAAADRRDSELRRRADVRRVDEFLVCIEDIIEKRRGEVPAPLMEQIIRFVRPISRKLLRALNRNVSRDPVRVLDVLFDVQQLLLPRLMVA